MARSRNYVFTINNYTDEDIDQCYAMPWEVKDCIYLCVGKEVGDNGTPHLQGCCCFSQPKSVKQISEALWRAHIAPKVPRSTFEEFSNYTKKDGDFFEWGILPMDQKKKGDEGGAAETARWADAIAAYGERRYSDIPADILGKCSKGLAVANTLLKLQDMDLSDTEISHEWYYGASRTGKSRKARTDHPDAYLKMCNKWWDGYEGQEVVLIEDFDKDHKVLVHHLKIWADRYKFPAEIKGGKIDIRPRRIIITSNYHPRDIWPDEKDLDPILRRFTITRFGGYELIRTNHVDMEY